MLTIRENDSVDFSRGLLYNNGIKENGANKMQIKKGFILRTVGGQNVVVAVGAASRSFSGIIRLNETGKFLWEQLSADKSENELCAALLDEYDLSEEQARADISAFVKKLKEAELLA